MTLLSDEYATNKIFIYDSLMLMQVGKDDSTNPPVDKLYSKSMITNYLRDISDPRCKAGYISL